MPETPPPALSDIALRETLDLLGQVVASMSARLDKQGEQIEAMAKAVEKTRSAAKRTEQQTDPAAYARFIAPRSRPRLMVSSISLPLPSGQSAWITRRPLPG